MDEEGHPGPWVRRAVRFSQEQFEELVAEALDGLPADIEAWLDNVTVLVAQQPTLEQLRQAGLRPGQLLFGLYQGVPKTRRGITYGGVLPDKILVFQRPIEQICRTREEVREQVRRTVLHEVGHHFGMGEEDLEDAGV